MKKILLLASSLAVIPLFTSCTDYGVYGTTVGRPIVSNGGFVGGGFGNPGFVGGGYAPLQVGFVATSFDRWAYDPFRRHYYDRSCGRYFDPRRRSYCTVIPRRYSSAVYPSGYRRGAGLACPSYLPRTRVVSNYRNHFGHGNHGTVASNRGRYSPVVHGSSRGSDRFRGSNRGDFNRGIVTPSRGSSYSPVSPVRRTVAPVPSRRSVNPSTVSRSGRLTTIGTNSSQSRISSPRRSSSSGSSVGRSSSSSRSSSDRFPTPTVRSRPTPVVRSQPSQAPSVSRSRPAPTVRSSGYNRSTSRPSPSRSVTKARQRTR